MTANMVILAVAAVLLAVRMTRRRSFQVNRLGVMPTAVLIVVAFSLVGTTLSSLAMAAIATGLLAGAVLGFWRAKLALDRIDVATRTIMTKPSVVFALVFAATFALKAFIRHGPVAPLQEGTDFVLCLTAASICGQRLQLYRMFRRAEATE